jgi:hypothetical protein
MRPIHKTVGTTLAEVLVALVVMSLVMMGIYCIQIFSDNQVVVSNRKAALQNEVSYILEHMTKYCGQAVGDGQSYAVNNTPSDYLHLWIDSDQDGILNTALDKRIYYRHFNSGKVTFCDDANSAALTCKHQEETLGNHIVTDFSVFTVNPATNFVIANISACWDPSSPATCGGLDNSRVNMSTCIALPSVSAN